MSILDPQTTAPAVPTAQLLQELYDQLRRTAFGLLRAERHGHTLQPTALVHEAYLRLADQHRGAWHSRQQFYRVAALLMRRILVNHARDRQRLKRGGAVERRPFVDPVLVGRNPIDVLILDEALNALQSVDARKVEITQLHVFAGFTLPQTADILGMSVAQIKRDWRLARAWLRRALQEEGRRPS